MSACTPGSVCSAASGLNHRNSAFPYKGREVETKTVPVRSSCDSWCFRWLPVSHARHPALLRSRHTPRQAPPFSREQQTEAAEHAYP